MSSIARAAALLLTLVLFCAPRIAVAQQYLGPPSLTPEQTGATIEKVTVETYGVITPSIARRYLSLHRGERLTQQGLNHDFTDLQRVGAYRTRVQIRPGSAAHTVDLHWIVMSRWLKPTSHPFYGDTPLSAPIQGVGWVLTGPPLDRNGSNVSSYTQLSRRANLARVLYTMPLDVNAQNGSASSFITDVSGGRGVYRASLPLAINVYSWSTSAEALYLWQGINGTQVEGGMRLVRSSDEANSAIEAPSLYNTFEHPARVTQIVAGVTHACITGPYRWFPPYCNSQYRVQATDGIGGFGATSTYRVVSADGVRYFSVGQSTVALHATVVRSGGILPDSFLLGATARGYPKPFAGTDAEGATLEYRIDDHAQRAFEVVLFTEDAAARVRGGDQPQALPYFTWHPDSGIGLEYHLVRIDLAYGKGGGRLTFELKGQLY